MEDSSGLPDDLETLQMIIEEADAKVLSLQGRMAQEEAKMERYKVLQPLLHNMAQYRYIQVHVQAVN